MELTNSHRDDNPAFAKLRMPPAMPFDVGDLPRAGLDYAARGWLVIPLHSPSDGECSCGRANCSSPAKHPRTPHGLKDASGDAEKIREWWKQWPDANIGILTGPESGILVLDVDGEAGRVSLAALEAKHGPLPATLTSITGRADGGEHRWFKYPPDREIRGNAGKLGNGLDVRAARGYVVAAPSRHSTGTLYEWFDPSASILSVPRWLLDRLEKISAPAQRREPIPAGEIGILAEGRRNDGLFRFASSLRRKGQGQSEIETELLKANIRRCRPPLSDAEIRIIAASAASYPIGGPDPLQAAWEASEGEYSSRRERFIALIRQLQSDRESQTIALPLQRIGELLRVHWTLIGQWRKRAVLDGCLEVAEQYIPHRKSGTYRWKEPTLTRESTLTREPESTLTKPIVRLVRADSPSESPHSHSESVENGSSPTVSRHETAEKSFHAPSENAKSAFIEGEL